jgi:hypothetical protein
MPKRDDLDTCRYCRRRISFGPYYVEKGVTVKHWTHKEGLRSCLTKPANWEGPWPKAMPVSGLP